MTIVWSLDLPDSDKIVLLALADCANDEGHCWPSVRSLMAKCSKSDRTIQAAIKRLVDAGHLTRREVIGKGCNYTVHPRRDGAPENASPRNSFPPKGTAGTPEAASDKPSRTINSETKVSSERVIEAWNEMAKTTGLSAVQVLDASRRQSLRLRLKEHGIDVLLGAIRSIGSSPWLRGEGRETNWRPDFDFFLSPSKLRRVIEGFYGASEESQAPQTDADRIKVYEERAAFFRRIDRPDDAADWEGRARALRSANGGRAMNGPVPIGSAASKILEGVRAQ